MPNQQRPIFVLGFVVVAWLAFRVLGQDLSPAQEGLLKIALWVVPCVIGVRWSAGVAGFTWRGVQRGLGLNGSIVGGLAVGLAATIPIFVIVASMIAGAIPRGSVDAFYVASFQIARIVRDWNVVVGNVILGPFAEEVLFRGFLIHELSTIGRWPAARVIAVSGLLFGLAHVGNGGAFLLIPGIAVGGAVFAWMTLHRRTIWPAIGVHAALNLWWDLFPTQALLGHALSLLAAVALILALGALERRRLAPARIAPSDVVSKSF